MILPSLHAVLFGLAAVVDKGSPYGYSPVFCVDVPVSLPMVARDNWQTLLAVAILGTIWWYAIGSLGWAVWNHKLSRALGALCAALVFLTCYADLMLMVGQVQGWRDDPRFTGPVIAVYALALLLLAGGATSAVAASVGVVKRTPQR